MSQYFIPSFWQSFQVQSTLVFPEWSTIFPSVIMLTTLFASTYFDLLSYYKFCLEGNQTGYNYREVASGSLNLPAYLELSSPLKILFHFKKKKNLHNNKQIY